MIEKIVFILWLCVIVLGVYFLVQLLRLNTMLNKDLNELENAEEMFNLDLQNFEKISFILIADENGTIFDKDGNSYRLERNNEHRK